MWACVLAQSCLTLCDTTDCSLPGSSVLGISQARILEWVAISSSRASSQPGIEPESPVSPALQADSLPLSYQGSPIVDIWPDSAHSARKALSLRIWQELSVAITVERIKSLGKNVKGISGYWDIPTGAPKSSELFLGVRKPVCVYRAVHMLREDLRKS